MRDPITKRQICNDCWHGMHQKGDSKCCKVAGCNCLCKDLEADRQKQSAQKAARTRERKTAACKALKDPANPLAAVNPAFKPKTSAHA